MSSELIRADDTPERAVATGDPTGGRLVAWAEAASAAHQLATSLARTSFVPRAFANNPADATAAVILGDELGLSPLSALRSIYVISGTPALYARSMVALVLAHGHQIWTEEESDQKVTVCGRRRGSDHVERVTWTTARARKAGYTSNRKYETDPVAMLYARASGDVARRIAPDVLAGVPYSAEELELSEPATTTKVSRTEGSQKVSRKKAEPEPEPTEPDLPEAAPVNDEPLPLTDRTRGQMFALFTQKGITSRDVQITGISQIIGRTIESRSQIHEDEALLVIKELQQRPDAEPAEPDPTMEPGWGDES